MHHPKGELLPLPENTPQTGEVFRHYKGDSYRVTGIARHSNDDEWMVVYEPLYEGAVATLFTRPLRQWREEVEWGGKTMKRFTLIQSQ